VRQPCRDGSRIAGCLHQPRAGPGDPRDRPARARLGEPVLRRVRPELDDDGAGMGGCGGQQRERRAHEK
jgi:hypothetical protein